MIPELKILIIIIAFCIIALPFIIFREGTWVLRLKELKPKNNGNF